MRPATAWRSTSGRCRSDAPILVAVRTRASRTSGFAARAIDPAMTGWGTKAEGEPFGPAPRGMDRFADRGRRGRRPDGRHRDRHPRSTPRRAGRSGDHPAARRRRLHVTGVLRLYPRWWRRRYGDEMRALLDAAQPRRGHRRDLVRGALDAWLHPPEPSHVPAFAALLGGGIWTTIAARVVSQPVQPDWPGYLLGSFRSPWSLRLPAHRGDRDRAPSGRRAWARTALAIVAALAGYGAWFVAMAGTLDGATDPGRAVGDPLAAMFATVGIGLLVRTADERLGSLVILAAGAMLLPWAGAWLVFGTCWTAIGLVILVARSLWFDQRRRLS